MVLLTFKPDDFLLMGLTLAGFQQTTIEKSCYATNLARFTSRYYLEPTTVALLFGELQTTEIPEAKLDKADPKYLLLALNYLKDYPHYLVC